MAILSELLPGQQARITALSGDDSMVQRLLEMGLTDGEDLEVVRFAPMGDPMEIHVRGYNLTLRKREAAAVVVELLPR